MFVMKYGKLINAKLYVYKGNYENYLEKEICKNRK